MKTILCRDAVGRRGQCFFACSFLLFAFSAFAALAPERWGVDLLTAPKEPDIRYTGDYAMVAFRDPWDFEEGDKEGFVGVGSGLEELIVRDGVLAFTATGPDVRLVWDGNQGEHPAKAMNFVWNCPENWRRWYVRMRVRQSALISSVTCKLAKPRTAQLTGNDWQIIEFFQGRTDVNHPPRLELAFKADERGNRLEIDWIKAEIASEVVGFRYAFDIPTDLESAQGWILAGPAFKVWGNGALAASAASATLGWSPQPIDLTEALHKGRNVIAVERETLPYQMRNNCLALGLRLVLTDGRVLAVKTGSGWSMSVWPEPGWMAADYDDSGWGAPGNGGDVALGNVDGDWNWIVRELRNEGRHPVPLLPLGRLRPDWLTTRPPLCRLAEGLRLRLRLAPGGLSRTRRIRYRILDAAERALISEGLISEPATVEGAEEIYEIRCRPSVPAVYVVTAELIQDEEILETVSFEAPLLGFIRQRRMTAPDFDENLGLRMVDTIDLADPNDPHPSIALRSTRQKEVIERSEIVDTAAGRCLSLPLCPDARSYQFSIKTPFRPHLGVLTYADIAKQAVGIGINEGFRRSRSLTRVGTGFVSGIRLPPTGKLREYRFVFFPGKGALTCTFVNQGFGPSRLAKFEVSEITNDLPMLDLPNESVRVFAYQFERSADILQSGFYGGTGGWQSAVRLYDASTSHVCRDWFSVWQNYFKYLRFTGQNGFSWMAWMYTSQYYDTPESVLDRYRYRIGLDMGLALASENNIKVFLGHEWLGTQKAIKADRYAEGAIRAGRGTTRAVAGDGTGPAWEGYIGEKKGFNCFHPDVEREMAENAAFLAKRYGEESSLQGLLFSCGGYFGPCIYQKHRQKDPLRYSYDDHTIAQFEKATGLRIPISGNDPQRFEKRYRWLTNAENLDQWVRWRCRRLADLSETIAKSVQTANPRLSCSFIWGEWSYGLIHTSAWIYDGIPWQESMRKSGIHFGELTRRGTFRNGVLYEQIGSLYKGRENPLEAYDGVRLDPSIGAAFDGHEPDVVYLHHPFAERHHVDPTGQWPVTRFSYCLANRPTLDDYYSAYAQVFTHTVPATLVHGYTDCNAYAGNEIEIREIAKVFRSIPAGKLANPRAPGQGDNLLVRAHENGNVFLVINPTPWRVDGRIIFRRRTFRFGVSEVVDRVSGKILGAGSAEITLGPGHMRLLELRPSGRLKEVQARAMQDPLLEAGVRRLTPLLEMWKGLIESQVEHSSPIEKRYLAQGQAISSALVDGHYLRAYFNFHSQEFLGASYRLKDKLFSYPWMVIGPFENQDRNGFRSQIGPEKDILAGNEVKEIYTGKGGESVYWRPIKSTSSGGSPGVVDLAGLFGDVDHAVALARSFVHSSAARPARLNLGSDDGLKVYVNGKQVFSIAAQRGLTPDQDHASIELEKGWNEILVKCDDLIGGWGYQLHVVSRRGGPVWDLRFSAARPGQATKPTGKGK